MSTIQKIAKDAESDDFYAEVSKGNLPTHAYVNKFGVNFAVPTTTEVTLASQGGIYVYPSTELQMTLQSTSSNDTLAGTGAQKVRIYGQDINNVPITEVVEMNGLTPVNTIYKYYRVFRIKVIQAGVLGGLAGNITVENGGTTYAEVTFIASTITNQTLMALYTIPAGYTAYLKRFDFHSGFIRDTQVTILAREPGEPFQMKAFIPIRDSGDDRTYDLMPRFPEKTDIEMRAKNLDASQTLVVSGTFDLLLRKNNNDVVDLP
jgi:hypothetical protein